MKVLISVLTFLLLSACQQPQAAENKNEEKTILIPTKGADGYLFEQSEFEATKAKITIIRHSTYESIGAAWNKLTKNDRPPTDGYHILAFTDYKVDDKGVSVCVMHIIDPKIEYRPDIIGHEFVHCINGNFHPSVGP